MAAEVAENVVDYLWYVDSETKLEIYSAVRPDCFDDDCSVASEDWALALSASAVGEYCRDKEISIVGESSSVDDVRVVPDWYPSIDEALRDVPEFQRPMKRDELWQEKWVVNWVRSVIFDCCYYCSSI